MKHADRFRRKAVTAVEAQAKVTAYAHPLPPEMIEIQQSLGRTLAEDIDAPHDWPCFRRSGMDGYAVRCTDIVDPTPEDPAVLEVTDIIPAGKQPEKEVAPGQAARIMTGAAVPEGADAVVMFEHTRELSQQGKKMLHVRLPVKKGQNIALPGGEIKKGQRLMVRGETVEPGHIAMLAAFGIRRIRVYRKPKVGILATGSELLELESPLRPGKIRNSNSYMLAAQVARSGGVPVCFANLPDEEAEAVRRIEKALSETDLLITTGGVSVGDYDIMTTFFQRHADPLLFNKVAMRPGSPTTAGRFLGKMLFGLSGNPGACFVGFELFVRPFLKKMLGKSKGSVEQTAVLDADFPKASPLDRFVRGRVYLKEGRLYAKPAVPDKSSVISTLMETNALLCIPRGSEGLDAGRSVSVILLNHEGFDER